jgi:hypothetical protein
VTFTLSARQIWSANPDRALTVCTRHTPFDVAIPERPWTGVPLGRHVAHRKEDGSWQQLEYISPAMRINYQDPEEEDWQEKLGFITIPAMSSEAAYTIDREIDLSYLSNECKPKLLEGGNIEFKLVNEAYKNSPKMAWWNWGDLEGDLKGKKLGYRSDPVLNDKDREEERKHLPNDLALGFDNWRDTEDDEGNEMIRLEVEWDNSTVSVQVLL